MKTFMIISSLMNLLLFVEQQQTKQSVLRSMQIQQHQQQQ